MGQKVASERPSLTDSRRGHIGPWVMTAGQRQKRATALGASGFAYKMLLWPDLAFMGNPLNSDPFKLKWTFLAGAAAPRSQIICMV